MKEYCNRFHSENSTCYKNYAYSLLKYENLVSKSVVIVFTRNTSYNRKQNIIKENDHLS